MSTTPSSRKGGIIWKNIAGHRRIAILSEHSDKKGWKLPVYETDSYDVANPDPFVEIGKLVGTEVKDPISADTAFYPDLDPPEYVAFWHLRVKANAEQLVPKGGHNVKWVTPLEATKLLTRDAEKKLIQRVELPPQYFTFMGGNTTLRYDFQPEASRRQYSEAMVRLEGDLRAFSAVLEYRIRKNTYEDGSIPAWGVQAGALVNMAHEQMKRGKLDPAWKSLHSSIRLSIFGMSGSERSSLASRIRQEAINVNNWRRSAIYRILGEVGTPDEIPEASALYQAAEIRDEHFSNNYYKHLLTKSVISTLLVLLSVSVVLIFAYFACTTFALSNPVISVNESVRTIQILPMLTGVLLFGLFGGSISSLFKVRSTSTKLKNPELINSHFFTTIRVFTGGAAAIAFFVLLESEFADLLTQNIQVRPTTEFTYYAISFVCGFSERLLLRAISSVTDRD